jgi:hypothetical protein
MRRLEYWCALATLPEVHAAPQPEGPLLREEETRKQSLFKAPRGLKVTHNCRRRFGPIAMQQTDAVNAQNRLSRTISAAMRHCMIGTQRSQPDRY